MAVDEPLAEWETALLTGSDTAAEAAPEVAAEAVEVPEAAEAVEAAESVEAPAAE